ncbi:MAG: FecCD family ABC transporter permease [Thermocrispum sp.]
MAATDVRRSPLGLEAVRLRGTVIVPAVAILLGAGLLGILVGPIGLSPPAVVRELIDRLPFLSVSSGLSDQEAAILWELRVPRVALAGVVGAALASSGAAFQGVFRNPLADPFLLGAAAGAGMAATMVVVFAPALTAWAATALPLAAFAGAVGGVALSWLLSTSYGGVSPATLLLAGVAVSAFLTAVQTFVQQLNADTIRQVYGWMLGGLKITGWSEFLQVIPYIAGAAVVLLVCARLLDVLALGDAEASSLGVRPGQLRLVLIAAASLATAAAVSVSGLIGFVGIIVPHVVRLTAGASYRVIMPLSLLGGATFLIVADQIARTAMPGELPIGVVTAFAGAPFFILVLRRNREKLW